MAAKILIAVISLIGTAAFAKDVTLGDPSEGRLVYEEIFEMEPSPNNTATGIKHISVPNETIKAIEIEDLQGDGRVTVLDGGVGKSDVKLALYGDRDKGFKFRVKIYVERKPEKSTETPEETTKSTQETDGTTETEETTEPEETEETEETEGTEKPEKTTPMNSRTTTRKPGKNKKQKKETEGTEKSEKTTPMNSRTTTRKPGKNKKQKKETEGTEKPEKTTPMNSRTTTRKPGKNKKQKKETEGTEKPEKTTPMNSRTTTRKPGKNQKQKKETEGTEKPEETTPMNSRTTTRKPGKNKKQKKPHPKTREPKQQNQETPDDETNDDEPNDDEPNDDEPNDNYNRPNMGLLEFKEWINRTEVFSDKSRVCSKLRGLTPGQRRVCRRHKDHMPAVGDGARRGIQECQHQFMHRRWNCTVTGDETVFGPLTLIASRETAFTYAITAAGVSLSISRACRDGRLTSCGCSRATRPRHLHSDWVWGGCGDNLEYGYKFTEGFVDIRERERKVKRGSREQGRQLMNRHNNEAGRRAVIKKSRVTCKCHGVSGSCSLITCWQQLANFREIGDYLRDKYEGATEVKVSRRGKLRLSNPDYSLPTAQDLVYLEESPNYCIRNMSLGSPGTAGRQCNRTSAGLDSCALMCCGRGYNTKKTVARERCQCKFHWCCRVDCNTCVKTIELYTCK